MIGLCRCNHQFPNGIQINGYFWTYGLNCKLCRCPSLIGVATVQIRLDSHACSSVWELSSIAVAAAAIQRVWKNWNTPIFNSKWQILIACQQNCYFTPTTVYHALATWLFLVELAENRHLPLISQAATCAQINRRAFSQFHAQRVLCLCFQVYYVFPTLLNWCGVREHNKTPVRRQSRNWVWLTVLNARNTCELKVCSMMFCNSAPSRNCVKKLFDSTKLRSMTEQIKINR